MSNRTVENMKDEHNRNLNIDTYIEQLFFEACSNNGGMIKYFYEWQTNKEIYEKNTKTIIYEFQNYSRHDSSHSMAILNAVERFLGTDRIERMSIGDLWLLLNAAYGHDIGMAVKYDEILDLWQNNSEFYEYIIDMAKLPEYHLQEEAEYFLQIHNLLTGKEQMDGITDRKYQVVEWTRAWPVRIRRSMMVLTNEYFRKNHVNRSKKFFENFIDASGVKVAERRLYKALERVIYSHGESFSYVLKDLEYEEDGFGKDNIHPKFIAAMLRLGDLLDMDNGRFDAMAMEHFGELPYVSKEHLKKHLALSHLRITDRQIEATERTEEGDVSDVCLNWFRMIDEEVKNITNSWNRIVPLEMGGCTFRECKLEVYLNGELCNQKYQKEYKIDKKKFMDMLIGDKLYNDALVFIREYVQNAMDASKVMISRNGDRDWKINLYKSTILKAKEIHKIPLALNTDYLSELEIKLIVDFDETYDNLKISFEDAGIGMDEECCKMLTLVGESWKGRKKYHDDLIKMESWLRPTGGFGVGLQSGFMVSPQISIQTLAENEGKGRNITMTSPRSGGEIRSSGNSSIKKVGTKVTLEVNFEDFMDRLASEVKTNNRETISQTSFLMKQSVLKIIAKQIEEYIKRVIPDCILPIRICYGAKDIIIKGRMYSLIENSDRTAFCYSKELECVYTWVREDEQKKLCLWDMKEEYYAEISMADKGMCTENLCFRGIKVETRMADNTSDMNDKGAEKPYLYELGMNIFIDLMANEAEEWLLMSRSGVQPNKREAIQRIERKTAETYIRLLTGRTKENDFGWLRDYDMKEKGALVAGVLTFGDEKRKIEWSSLNNGNANLKGWRIQDNGTWQHEEGITYEEFADFVSENKMVLWRDTSRTIDTMQGRVDTIRLENVEKDVERVAAGSEGVRNRIEKSWCVKKDMIILDTESIYNFLFERCERKKYKWKLINKDNEILEINGIDFQDSGIDLRKFSERLQNYTEMEEQGYMNLTGVDDYEELYVSKLPYEKGKEYGFCVKNNIILMPQKSVTMTIYAKAKSWSELVEAIHGIGEEHELWENTVNWVLNHPKNQWRTKSEIEEKYLALLQEWFEICKAQG